MAMLIRKHNRSQAWLLAGALAPALFASNVTAQDNTTASEKDPLVFFGLSLEQFEYRFGDDADILAWKGDAFTGTDEWKLRLHSEGEYVEDEDIFEKLENQVALQWTISDFFDAKLGFRFDTPDGPNRNYAMAGIHGLAPQWYEIDADLFISDEGDVSARLDVDYELLITNRIILTPTAEINVAFSDDEEIGIGSGLTDVELGLRISYDLVDRSVAPYLGVHYERKFGKTADFAADDGDDDDELFFVAGVRLLF